MNYRELPLILLLAFMLVYTTIGDPDNPTWSGAYFFVNYTVMFMLFWGHKSKTIRKIGISLSVSILAFIVLKYFLHIECNRLFTLIPFTISFYGLIKLERYESRRRKDL
jgi:hypothetical protein